MLVAGVYKVLWKIRSTNGSTIIDDIRKRCATITVLTFDGDGVRVERHTQTTERYEIFRYNKLSGTVP